MRCYGYDPKGKTVVEHEAKILREVAQRVLAGEKIHGIVPDLRRRGVETSRGLPWTETSLSRLLRTPRIAGLQRDGETVAEWPPIITRAEREQLLAILNDPSRSTVKGTNKRKHLLTGFLTCGRTITDETGEHVCGKPLYSQHSETNKLGYVCRLGSPSYGCGRIRIGGAALEEVVVAKALARLASPKIRARLQRAVGNVASEGYNVEQALADLDERLRVAGTQYAKQRLSITTMKAVDAAVKKERQDLLERAARAERLRHLPATTPEGLAEWWVDAPLERRRELLALVLESVQVNPAPRRGNVALDEERLEFHWK